MASKKLGYFLRGLGLVYGIAFLSLWFQIDGLIGKNGILPLEIYIENIKNHLHFESLLYFPTLSLLNSSDFFTHLLCIIGLFSSLYVILGYRNKSILLLLWLLYLSLCIDFQDFLSFQWDILLLEVGFLSIFLNNDNNTAIIWIFRVLLFKLMFSSGLVKLTSGDIHWRNLSALSYHFLTQPLPLPLSWTFSHFSSTFLKILCFFMFFIELIAPFFIFMNAYLRKMSAFLIILFMIIIFLTGNYTFFNILTIFLTAFLFIEPSGKSKKWHWIPATLYFFISGTQIIDASHMFDPWPTWIETTREVISPLRSVNSYGLFQVMTTRRLEIDIQGSNTPNIESSWKSYIFKYKPGPLQRAPQWCEPFQARLDWQMWFAALGTADQNPWYINLLVRLLEGKKEVEDLFAFNPFPGDPPKYIRGKLYEYHFSTEEQRRETGEWWTREDLGLYSQPVFLTDNKLL